LGLKSFSVPKQPSTTIELLLKQFTRNQQSMEGHLLAIENENKDPRKKVNVAKMAGQQAI
jgi:hypothetical protein